MNKRQPITLGEVTERLLAIQRKYGRYRKNHAGYLVTGRTGGKWWGTL